MSSFDGERGRCRWEPLGKGQFNTECGRANISIVHDCTNDLRCTFCQRYVKLVPKGGFENQPCGHRHDEEGAVYIDCGRRAMEPDVAPYVVAHGTCPFCYRNAKSLMLHTRIAKETTYGVQPKGQPFSVLGVSGVMDEKVPAKPVKTIDESTLEQLLDDAMMLLGHVWRHDRDQAVVDNVPEPKFKTKDWFQARLNLMVRIEVAKQQARIRADVVKKMKKENKMLRNLVRWALGERDAFPDWPAVNNGKPHVRYWWRTELRRRFLKITGEKQ